MPLLSDRIKRIGVLAPTALLPHNARVASRRHLLGQLELARANRARLLIIGHPKSGNTWLRTMLSRLFQQRAGAASDYTVKSDELARHFNGAPHLLATNGHYSYEGVIGEALDEDAPDSPLKHKPVVFLPRHPCDIATSWYIQFTKRQSWPKLELINASIENPIDSSTISRWEFVRHSDIGLPMLIDFLNTWERRVSKLERGIVVRYEDLRADSVAELRRVFEVMGEPVSDAELEDTARWTSFENMSKLEDQGHFRRGGVQLIDKDDPETRKVRRAKVGGYREDFTPEQVAELDALVAERLSPALGYGKPGGTASEGA